MGMKAEFNWYIVIKDKNIPSLETLRELSNKTLKRNELLVFEKDEYRIYPMDTPLPLIYNGKCLALAAVTALNWKDNKTVFITEPIVLFEEGDPVATYYESSFEDYKKEQENINDGGIVDLRNIVNPAERKRF